jgi:hypothetical protein
VGNVKIRYYVTRRNGKWGYWAPCLARRNPKTKKIEPTLMAKLGFSIIDCGRDGPGAWAIAESWNAKWDAALAAHRAGVPIENIDTRERVFPTNSLGEGFARYRATYPWQAKKPRTKEDWWRGWDHIETVFGDVDPRTVDLAAIGLWYGGSDKTGVEGILQTLGIRESHRAMKIWRALWEAISTIKRDDGEAYVTGKDPSLGVPAINPKGRSAIWYEGEAVRLVKGAIRLRFYGLAAALAVAWDTQLSPVDVRTLTKAQLMGDAEGPFFTLDRAKTGQPAIGTFSKRTQRLLKAYMETLPPDLIPSAPIFMTRGGQAGPKGGRPRPPVPYTSDTYGDDFREVREAVFPGDTRKMLDFRRSGSVEALAGNFPRGALNAKMANTIEDSPELQRTYLPGQVAVVRLADEARLRGRRLLRGSGGPDGGAKS